MDERTFAGGRLKILPYVARLFALAPILAAGVWASLASRLPEPFAARQALGEVSMRLEWSEWDRFEGEPAHAVARAMTNVMFELPESTYQLVALLNALLVAGVVVGLAGLWRRTFSLGVTGHAIALAVAGLFACSPAFAADWLHVERAGLLFVPLLLLAALLLLHREGSLWWRGTLALLFAVIAPFCHGNGMFVSFALVPAVVDAARRANSRPVPWLVALLVVANVAAAVSMITTGRIELDGVGLVGRFADDPLATLETVLGVTGAAWLDPLPGTHVDSLALGALSWLAPLVLWRIGDRSDAARRAAAPWWGCTWFGLLVPLWLLERHGVAVPADTLRELGFGTFLLPAGVVGLVAARFGSLVLTLGAGAALLLGAQDWHTGLEALRLAVMRVQTTETIVLLPDAFAGERPVSVLPVRLAAEWPVLEKLGRVPAPVERLAASRVANESSIADKLGALLGGDGANVHGVVRSSVFGEPVQCVLIVEQQEGKAPAVLGRLLPQWADRGRDVPWTIALDRAPAEGAVVGAYGWRPRRAATVALGPKFTMRDGRLTSSP